MTTDKLAPISEERLREIQGEYASLLEFSESRDAPVSNFYASLTVAEVHSIVSTVLSHRTPASTGEADDTPCIFCDQPLAGRDTWADDSGALAHAQCAAVEFATQVREREAAPDIERLTRPIIGVENRTAQEVFDIMCDRLRAALVDGGAK